jgi:hypothetical protein
MEELQTLLVVRNGHKKTEVTTAAPWIAALAPCFDHLGIAFLHQQSIKMQTTNTQTK